MADEQRNALLEFWNNILIKECKLNEQLNQNCDELSLVKVKLHTEKAEYMAEILREMEPNCNNYMFYLQEENLAFIKALQSQVESDRNKAFEYFEQFEQCKVDIKKLMDHSDAFDDYTDKPYDEIKTDRNRIVEDIRMLRQSLAEQELMVIKCCEESEASYRQLLEETAYLERFENESKCALLKLTHNGI